VAPAAHTELGAALGGTGLVTQLVGDSVGVSDLLLELLRLDGDGVVAIEAAADIRPGAVTLRASPGQVVEGGDVAVAAAAETILVLG